MNTQFEYRVVTLKYERGRPDTKPNEQSVLNSMGKEGWELVTVEPGSTGDAYFFKRPVGDWSAVEDNHPGDTRTTGGTKFDS